MFPLKAVMRGKHLHLEHSIPRTSVAFYRFIERLEFHGQDGYFVERDRLLAWDAR